MRPKDVPPGHVAVDLRPMVAELANILKDADVAYTGLNGLGLLTIAMGMMRRASSIDKESAMSMAASAWDADEKLDKEYNDARD